MRLRRVRSDGESYFRPVSKRRESVRLLTTDLANPAVVRFANMGDNLLPFMSLYSTCEVYEDEDVEPAVTLEDGAPIDTASRPTSISTGLRLTKKPAATPY